MSNNLHFLKLKQQWTKRHQDLSYEIFKNHKESFEWLTENFKQLTVGSLAGLFLLTQPVIAKVPTAFSKEFSQMSQTVDKKAFLVFDLRAVLPDRVSNLSKQQETDISHILTRDFGFTVVPELLGKRLNAAFGYIGQEQHLSRFPGDNIYTHF